MSTNGGTHEDEGNVTAAARALRNDELTERLERLSAQMHDRDERLFGELAGLHGTTKMILARVQRLESFKEVATTDIRRVERELAPARERLESLTDDVEDTKQGIKALTKEQAHEALRMKRADPERSVNDIVLEVTKLVTSTKEKEAERTHATRTQVIAGVLAILAALAAALGGYRLGVPAAPKPVQESPR